MADVGAIAGDRLRSFVERIERLEYEIKALNEDKSDVYKEAKSAGFDVKVLRELIRLRRMDEPDRNEREELIDLYMRAIGM
jgi:uncharacterized protein (UPF0335 family)